MLFELMLTHKLTAGKVATLLHVSVDTVDGWKKKKTAPVWAYKLLKRKINSVIEFPNLIDPTGCLKGARDCHQLKHADLANIIGVRPPLISNWLYHNKVPAWAAESLALALLFDPEVTGQLGPQAHLRARKQAINKSGKA